MTQYLEMKHRSGRSFKIDSKNGNVLDKKIKKKFWSREYEKGWDIDFN